MEVSEQVYWIVRKTIPKNGSAVNGKNTRKYAGGRISIGTAKIKMHFSNRYTAWITSRGLLPFAGPTMPRASISSTRRAARL